MNKESIFLVGVPRSGTTLLSAMLSAHSIMCCGPETHFFRRLSEIDVDQICDIETWPNAAARFLCKINHSGVTVASKYQINEDDIIRYLSQRQPSIPNILSCFTEQYMKRFNKSRWVEKTPDHLLDVWQIRKFFPSSFILRILRDPRDVALSLLKVPWGPRTFMEALLLWKKYDKSSKDFFDNDNLSYTCCFEDIILEPEKELRKICNFIGEDFEINMLTTSISSKSVNSRNVSWKQMASMPPDKTRVLAWKRVLTKSKVKLAECILGDSMKAYGYSLSEEFYRLGIVYPTFEFVQKYPDEFESLSLNGIRLWKQNLEEKPKVKIYLGNPAMMVWHENRKIKKIIRILLIITDIIKSKFLDNTIYWIADQNRLIRSGISSYILMPIFEHLKVVKKVNPTQK